MNTALNTKRETEVGNLMRSNYLRTDADEPEQVAHKVANTPTSKKIGFIEGLYKRWDEHKARVKAERVMDEEIERREAVVKIANKLLEIATDHDMLSIAYQHFSMRKTEIVRNNAELERLGWIHDTQTMLFDRMGQEPKGGQ
jgi:DNA-directed RNA polymerase beta' subunit